MSETSPWRRRMLLLAPLSVLLDDCGGAPPPAILDLTIKAGADQNPETDGKAAPVAIRVYQLTAAGGFENADVFALTEHETATLGPNLLQSEDFVLAPGESRPIHRTLKIGAQFLGVAVLFRDIDHAHWRATAPLNTSGPTTLALSTKRLVATLK